MARGVPGRCPRANAPSIVAVRPLDEQTILVTGATDGLGRALARELAGRGATVLAHGRSRERGETLLEELGGAPHRLLLADLAELRQVRALAERAAAATDRIDVLVNNAGIGTTLPGDGARLESADGYELRFAVNHLAGFLLTRLLLDEGRITGRIVNVASAGQMPIDFDDPMLERGYSGTRAYCQSKLAQVLFTFDLAERLGGRPPTVTALHPATYMPTKMVTHAGATPVSSLEQGTRATLRLVADPALEGVSGAYFNGEREARADPQAYDPGARRRLWELSERLTGLGGGGGSAREAP
jgi:NAD(P)-dependent dehydrogenase (short-subunit alcohol dehydrogenase family)